MNVQDSYTLAISFAACVRGFMVKGFHSPGFLA